MALLDVLLGAERGGEETLSEDSSPASPASPFGRFLGESDEAGDVDSGKVSHSEQVRAESALVHIPSLNRELWISSDSAEAARFGQELEAEGDERPVLLADDMVRLRGQDRQLIDATVRALEILGGRLTTVGIVLVETFSGLRTPLRLASDERLNDLDVVDGGRTARTPFERGIQGGTKPQNRR